METKSLGTILVIDDSKKNLKLMTSVLESEGYKVLQALSGTAGLNVAMAGKPDLILMDIRMPDLDGYETCRLFKAEPALNPIPVIFLSGLTEQKEKLAAFREGGVDYIEKPVQSQEVLARVKNHIQLFRMQTSLTAMVDARTRQLVKANKTLKSQIRQRMEVERKLRLDEERLESLLHLNDKEFTSEEKVIEVVLEEAVRLTGSHIGYFHFIDPGQITLTLTTWSKSVLKECNAETNMQYPLETAGVWADCMRTGKPALHNDYESLDTKKGLPEGHVRVKRHLSVPIFEKDQMMAIIGVGNKTDFYNDSDIRQLTLFSQGMWRLIQKIRYEKTRESLEGQLRQAQKMEAIGTLAGGIAHDFNNILSPILGYAELEMENAEKGSSTYNNLKELYRAGERARELVAQILTFSRKGEDELRPLLLQPVIKEALKLIKASLPSTIKIQQDIDQTCRHVLANPVQIHQIIMNLCTNAYHAMKDHGGTLVVNLNRTDQDESKTIETDIPGPRYFAKLIVRDTGTGMSKEVQGKIFDPYFTTKKKGEGTGLGLSVIHGIVGRLGGRITVDSEPNIGTAFTIYLPLVAADEPQKDKKGDVPLPKGNKHLLIVDDEPYVTRLLSKMLIPLGYRITEKNSSLEALETFCKTPDRFDLVVTDLTMPDLTGLQLAQKIFAHRRDIPIILCTGFGDPLEKQDLKSFGICDVLKKPVILKDIAYSLHHELDKKNRG